MKTSKQAINNVLGQLQGINRMIDEQTDCFSIIIQIKAARSALDTALEKFIQENFSQCSSLCKKTAEKDKLSQLITALIKK